MNKMATVNRGDDCPECGSSDTVEYQRYNDEYSLIQRIRCLDCGYTEDVDV